MCWVFYKMRRRVILKVFRCFTVICGLILFAGLMPAFGEVKGADAISGATIRAALEAQEFRLLPGTIVVEKNRRVRLHGNKTRKEQKK